MSDLKVDPDILRHARRNDAIWAAISLAFMVFGLPFAVSAYASLWGFAWRLIP